MQAHHTNDNVLTIEKLLGHKRIENTMKYIGMTTAITTNTKSQPFTTIEEAKQVLTAGFDFVTEKNGIMLFRKPRRFSRASV